MITDILAAITRTLIPPMIHNILPMIPKPLCLIPPILATIAEGWLRRPSLGRLKRGLPPRVFLHEPLVDLWIVASQLLQALPLPLPPAAGELLIMGRIGGLQGVQALLGELVVALQGRSKPLRVLPTPPVELAMTLLPNLRSKLIVCLRVGGLQRVKPLLQLRLFVLDDAAKRFRIFVLEAAQPFHFFRNDRRRGS